MYRIAVELRNRVAAFVDPYPAEMESYFSFQPKGYFFAPSYKRRQWDGYIRLLRYNKVASGLFLELRKQIETDLGIKFVIFDYRQRLHFKQKTAEGIRLPNGYTLRDNQSECIERMIRASRTGGLILNATGIGKTVTAGMFLYLLKGAGLFIVDELTLLDQSRKELESVLGEKVGMVGDGVFSPRRITVATIQTLDTKRLDPRFTAWQDKLQAIIIDEVHLALNKRTERVLHCINPLCVFGLTATLEVQKKEVLLKALALTGRKLHDYGYAKGVQDKHLTPGVVIGVDLVRDVPTTGVYHEDYRKYQVRSKRRNQLVSQIVRQALDLGKHVVVLVDRIDHVKRLSRRLKDISHQTIFGERTTIERVQAKAGFESEEIRLLIVNRVFQKGINLKKLDVIIDASAGQGSNQTIQKFGRGVRLCENKRGLIYFDIGDQATRPGAFLSVALNRFTISTKARRAALRSIGVKIFTTKETDAKKLLEIAETQLSLVISR